MDRVQMDMLSSASTITGTRMLGTVPTTHEPDDFNLYVRVVGGTVIVSRSDTDEEIVRGAGFDKAMQNLANYYNLPVTVTADYGVTVTKKMGEWQGTWQPSNTVAERRLADGQTMVKVDDLITVQDLADARDDQTTPYPHEYVSAEQLKAAGFDVPAPKHAYGRSAMLCGADMNLSGSSTMAYVTCQACKDALIVRAASGELITDGMAVWDYNLDLGIVDLSTLTSDGWFNVSTRNGERGSLMNGDRVTTRHPVSRVLAADVLAALRGTPVESTAVAPVHRHEPSYEFVISSHNNIDYATCQCGQLIQGNREDGYRLRADVLAERETARAIEIEQGMPKVGDWLHNDTAGVTGRVVLINAHGRITLDTGDGHTRSAHWDVLSGEGFEIIESCPAADTLMTVGAVESSVCAVADCIHEDNTPGCAYPCPTHPVGAVESSGRPTSKVGKVRGKAHPCSLSKPSATKVNRRKRKATRASRRRTGGRA